MWSKRIELLLFFAVPFLSALIVIWFFPDALIGGDYYTHLNMELGPFYPKTLHLIVHQIGIHWSYISAISVGAFFASSFLLFGRWTTLAMATYSKLGVTILTAGVTPMLFALAILFFALYKDKPLYSLLSGLLQRGIFVLSLFFFKNGKKDIVIMIIVVLLSFPYLLSFIGYFHWGFFDFLMSLTDIILILPLFLFGWKCYGQGGQTRRIYLMALLCLGLSLVSYTSRFIFLFSVFAMPGVIQAIKDTGRFAPFMGIAMGVLGILLEYDRILG